MKILVTLLLVTLVWFGHTIVRLENIHYAMLVGTCSQNDAEWDPDRGVVIVHKFTIHEMAICLKTVQTRTSPMWHLYYALTDE